jgi:6-phosphogluconolactonase
MASLAWLDRVNIPAANIHIIPAEHGAAAAAKLYAEQLQNQDIFDLVLLGLGQDGHTASLFPGQAMVLATDSPDVLPVSDAPKPPPARTRWKIPLAASAASAAWLTQVSAVVSQFESSTTCQRGRDEWVDNKSGRVMRIGLVGESR